MSDYRWERTLCAVELLTMMSDCQKKIITLLLTEQTTTLATYIAQLRSIQEELNRLHSKALNFQNVAQLAENIASEQIRRSIRTQ